MSGFWNSYEQWEIILVIYLAEFLLSFRIALRGIGHNQAACVANAQWSIFSQILFVFFEEKF